MYVVVVGSRERRAEEDKKQVSVVLDALRKKYRDSLIVVSTSCDVGIGQFVKEKCRLNNKDFQLIEITQRLYADIPKKRLVRLFSARNEMLLSIGDEFHIFVSPGRHDTFESELLTKVSGDSARVLKVYLPGEDPTAFVGVELV